MQDIYVHEVHGFVSPSPEKRMTLDAIMPAKQVRSPTDRKQNSLALWERVLSSPKNRGDTICIVLMPQSKP